MNTTYVKDEKVDKVEPPLQDTVASTEEVVLINEQLDIPTSTEQTAPTTSSPIVAVKSPLPPTKQAVPITPSKPALSTPASKPIPTPTPTASRTEQTVIPASKLKWGVFTGSNLSDLKEFERKVNVNPDYLAYFVHWGNHGGILSPWTKSVTYERDRTLVLFWEASDYIIGGTDQPAYSYKAILRGDHDAYIKKFAEHLREFEGPVILIPFSELNGDWSPWSGTKNGNTPAEAVKAFQYVHSFFDDAPNVSFGWAVNALSIPNTPENHISFYYPGDAYVDIVGVDGFNFANPWVTFDQKFSSVLTTLSKYNKPTFIFSFGSAEGPEKATWLDDALNVQLPKYPFVTSWVYFNQNKERNWLLWSDKETFSVFQEYISK